MPTTWTTEEVAVLIIDIIDVLNASNGVYAKLFGPRSGEVFEKMDQQEIDDVIIEKARLKEAFDRDGTKELMTLEENDDLIIEKARIEEVFRTHAIDEQLFWDFMAFHERCHGYLEDKFPQLELVKIYPVDGLTERHVALLRDLDLPKLALAFEIGIALRDAAPVKHPRMPVSGKRANCNPV